MNSAYNYQYLEKLTELYVLKEKTHKNVYILACQHILEPQAVMFDMITDFGVPKENIRIFGKIYSTSNEIYNELLNKNFNISKPIFNPEITFDDDHVENCKRELQDFLAIIKQDSKIIILDDGGSLLQVVNDQFLLIPEKTSVIGVEQTSSGFRKLEDTKLNFPIFNVARSNIKLEQESPLIAELGFSRILDVIKKYSIVEPKILIVGLGPIGKSLCSVFENKGFNVKGYDILHHDETELIDLTQDSKINIVIGATGKNILDISKLKDIILKIDHSLYLISMSSADREFPATEIRKNGSINTEIHGDVVWEDVILVNNGFPITFKGNRYESTPKDIEKTIGLLYASVLEAITNENLINNKFIDVPDFINNILK